MKTLIAQMGHYQKLHAASREQWLRLVAVSMRDVATLLIAVLAAATVITLSVWVTGTGMGPVLGAGTWALGFVFLGLAMDSSGQSALVRAVTGVALPVLALLQARVSADFTIVSGVLLAAWAGYTVLKRLSVQVTN